MDTEITDERPLTAAEIKALLQDTIDHAGSALVTLSRNPALLDFVEGEGFTTEFLERVKALCQNLLVQMEDQPGHLH
jgi:hypothetical protein